MTATVDFVEVKVLNGFVKTGDKIAYSTRSGSYQDMTIGTVVEVTEKPNEYTRTLPGTPALKVRPFLTSGYHTAPYKIVTLTVLDRVVKLGADDSTAAATLAGHVEWLNHFGGDFAKLIGAANLAGKDDLVLAAAGAKSAIEMCIERLTA